MASVAAVVLVGAPLTGQRDILRIGVLLAVLLLVAWWTTSHATRTLEFESRSSVGYSEAGSVTPVHLSIRGCGRVATRLVLEDRVPLALGGTSRIPVPRLADGETLDLRYTVHSEVRGSYPLGPTTLWSRDVFGLLTAARPLGGTAILDVLPRVYPLRDLTLGDLGGARGSSGSAAAATSPDDSSIREYRTGDDLRRVHWRSTARRGTVMVRSDEHPGRPDVVLLLDDRSGVHHGRGTASSLEWAITAAASAAVHLHRRGHRVQLLHSGALHGVHDVDETSAVRSLLRSLARLQPGPMDGLARSVGALGRTESTLLVAILGSVDEADVHPLLTSRPLGAPALAILQRTGLWGQRPSSGTENGSSDPDNAERSLQRAHLVLARAGWRTAIATPTDSVPDVWGRLARVGARSPRGQDRSSRQQPDRSTPPSHQEDPS